MLEAMFRGCKQHQIVCEEQTVDRAVPNSDIFVDLAVDEWSTHADYE